jgi:hypothetical protein
MANQRIRLYKERRPKEEKSMLGCKELTEIN